MGHIVIRILSTDHTGIAHPRGLFAHQLHPALHRVFPLGRSRVNQVSISLKLPQTHLHLVRVSPKSIQRPGRNDLTQDRLQRLHLLLG